MKRYLLLLPILLMILTIQSQAAVISAKASPLLLPGLVEIGQPFTVDIYMNNNDGTEHLGYSMPFVFYSPQGITTVTHRDVGGLGPFNSITMSPSFLSYWSVLNQWTGFNFDGNLGDTINHTAVSISGWPFGLGEQKNIQFALQINQEGIFCIDSCSIPNQVPPGKFDWLFDFSTTFNGPYCWEIGVMPEDPEISVAPGSFLFEGTAGQSAPSAQLLHITNTGVGTLNWTAAWNSSWVGMSPAFGTAPSNVQVFVNTIGLGAGNYYDTITVSDPNATNNPVLIPIHLILSEPPATIDLSQTFFSFNAIVDSANPSDQYLTVDNIGGGTLNWTATKSKSWLTLTPSSGVDYGVITLSVDITGLSYGFYYDTVVVSAPGATNTPQKAAVRLQVASSLPILGLNPGYMFVAVDSDTPVPETRYFEVYNGGAGAMNFYLEENSPRIASLTPDSGAVPQLVAITFDSVYCGFSMSYTDTIWAYSLEAPNSPQMLILDYHCYSDPAKIIVSKDTINAALYECGQGMNPPPPPFFTVYNGGSVPFTFDLSWNSDWLIPSDTSALAPKIITLSFDYKNMLPGVYYDTIVISAYNAVNTPESLTLTLTIKETDIAPLIYLNRNNLSFYAQENRVGRQFFVTLNNVHPGCMDWYIQEDMPWMDFGIDVKDEEQEEAYPWNLRLMPNGYGMTFGYYKDTALIVSDSASNSPYPLVLDISIWKFYGDADWNGSLNILDIAYLIKYLYKGGLEPKPMKSVGDCNCDLLVNLIDITILIDYIYHDGQPICGNPY
ncbi:MAG: hypothetical protein CVT49_01985 [candidate division Zixibacteria bacterium HGW-Zixibacteria-1]|nr:MAG: hypothetical protein CVT49_01985 [candidate division Zixibacteria bacterium HGW-Zixibacteria-1]